jgi:hypothetical protein
MSRAHGRYVEVARDPRIYTACRKAALNYCPLVVSCHEPQPPGPEESSASGPARPGPGGSDIGGNEQNPRVRAPLENGVQTAGNPAGRLHAGPGRDRERGVPGHWTSSLSASQAATFGWGSVVGNPPQDNFVAVAWLLPEQKTRRKTSVRYLLLGVARGIITWGLSGGT